jgi:uncharacterized protein (TIGR02246 family)
MPGKATALVAGAKQWATHYGAYANGAEGAALTLPLRARAAWDANDAQTFADLFTADGSELIGDTQLRGRDEILRYLTEAFEGPYKGSRLSLEPLEVNLLTDRVAVAVTEGGMLRSGETTPAPENTLRAVWVIVKQDRDWKLFAHQTSPLGAGAEPANSTSTNTQRGN